MPNRIERFAKIPIQFIDVIPARYAEKAKVFDQVFAYNGWTLQLWQSESGKSGYHIFFGEGVQVDNWYEYMFSYLLDKEELIKEFLSWETHSEPFAPDSTDNHKKYLEALSNKDVVGMLYRLVSGISSLERIYAGPIMAHTEEAKEAYSEVMDFLHAVKSGAKCPHCGSELYLSDLPQYDHTCHNCDENFYDFEATRKDGVVNE